MVQAAKKDVFDGHVKALLNGALSQVELVRGCLALHPSPPADYANVVESELEKVRASIQSLEQVLKSGSGGSLAGRRVSITPSKNEDDQDMEPRRRARSLKEMTNTSDLTEWKKHVEEDDPTPESESASQQPTVDGVINPLWTGKYVWDVLVVLLVLIDVMIVPVQLAYLGDHPTAPVMIVWPWLLLVFFCADITLNFFTAFRAGLGMKDIKPGTLVTDKAIIARHYVCSRAFLIDVITTIPFWMISDNGFTGGLLASIAPHLRFLRIVRMLRLAKLSVIAERIEERMGSLVFLQTVAFLRCVFTLLCICHWNACFWWMMGLEDNPLIAFLSKETQAAYKEMPHWVSVMRPDGYDGEDFAWKDRSIFESYIFCFYWTLGVMRTMPSEVLPTNLYERMYVLMFMFLAFSIFAVTVAQVVAAVTKFSERSRAFKEDLMAVHMYLNSIEAPRTLKETVTSYIKHLFLHRRIQAKELALIGLLPASLRSEVKCAQLGKYLRQIPRFGKEKNSNLATVSGISEVRYLEQGCLVSQRGCVADGAWVRMDGHLTVYDETSIGDSSQDEVTLVDTACLNVEAAVVSKNTVVARTCCEVLYIPKKPFLDLQFDAAGIEMSSESQLASDSSAPLLQK